jgi:hypothetical protein
MLTFEQANDQVLNIIPLHFAVSGNLQEAVNEAFRMVLRGIACAEELSTNILERMALSSLFADETRRLVEGYRDVWVGILHWQ